MVMEQIVELLVDHGKKHVSTLMLIVVLKTMAPSWAIFDTPIDQTSALA
jgi:hypothetical protein